MTLYHLKSETPGFKIIGVYDFSGCGVYGYSAMGQRVLSESIAPFHAETTWPTCLKIFMDWWSA